jgi:hypothetical protein
MRTLTTITLLIVTLTLSGCSSKVSVSGTVKYRDGEPLPMGMVIFELNPTYQVFGMIKPDGTYRMGEDQNGNGIRKGEYKVRVESREGGGSDGMPLVRYVDDKYRETATSGLTCNVQGKTVYNIEVEKPEK